MSYFSPLRRLALQATLGAALSTALLGASLAQTPGYTGPSNAASPTSQNAPGYSGPSAVRAMSVKELSEHGVDDQRAILRGRIVSHEGGKHYTFQDDTGSIRVEIKAKLFPAQQTINEKTLVELSGELDRGWRKREFEVDHLRVL
jgi:uncharacterized protein (TIGR00156 family)